MFASADWARKNPNTLQAYLSALYMAQAYMQCHESEVAALSRRGEPHRCRRGAALMKLNTYEMLMDAAFLSDAQKWSDFFEQFGLFKKHHALRDVVDSSTLDRAVKSVVIPADWSTCRKS